MERSNKPLPETKNKFHTIKKQQELLKFSKHEKVFVEYTIKELDKLDRASHFPWGSSMWMNYL